MKNLLTITILIICLSGYQTKIIAQPVQWASGTSGLNNESMTSITQDKNGNVYVAGSFSDSIIIQNLKVTSPGSSVYVAIYDNNGFILSLQAVAGGYSMYVSGLSVNDADDITLTGGFMGPVVFPASNPVTLNSLGSTDIFIARIKSTGSLDWANRLGNGGYDYSTGLGSDSLGNIYVAGGFHQTSMQNSPAKLFLSKYDASGNFQWTISAKSYSAGTFCNSIKTDKSGNSYLAGQFINSLTFDSVIILNPNNIETNAFAGRIDANGNAAWLNSAGASSGSVSANAIQYDGNGNTYFTGSYHGTVSFGSSSITSSPGATSEMFIAKSDLNGNYTWVVKGTGAGSGSALVPAGNGKLYLAGQFSSTLQLGPLTVNNSGSPDIYISQVSDAGQFDWVSSFSSTQNLSLSALSNNYDGVYISGSFADKFYFGNDSLTGSGLVQHGFLAKLMNNSVGVTDLTFKHKIFPNPANDVLRILGLKGTQPYAIFDQSGRVVLNGFTGGVIVLKELDAGLYFLRMEKNGTGLPFYKN
jgi:hypothetical protein